MVLLSVIVMVSVLAWVLRRPMKSHPLVFYMIAIALNACYLACLFIDIPMFIKKMIFLLMQKCTLAVAVFIVVMFIGVFRRDSKVSIGLRPVRSELSIIGCLLTIGHMVMYVNSFLPRLVRGTIDSGFLFFFCTAIALLILLLVLGVTSVDSVKRKMTAAKWKQVQRWAYVFFLLIYVHLLSILTPAAATGAGTARNSIIIYTVIFGIYLVARIHRAVADRSDGASRLPAHEGV